MKTAQVKVPWPEGLHLRRALQLAKAAQRYHADIRLRAGERIADLRSIVSVLALCATMGATLELEASGDDEQEATQAVLTIFEC